MDETVIKTLEAALDRLRKNGEHQKMVSRKEPVLKRFQPIFSPAHVAQITEQEFKSFLLFENNCHWGGLHRLGPKICANLDQLRAGLSILLDESKPIGRRFDEATAKVPGMGKAIATAILLIAYPNKYGVWNRTSETAMREFGIFPERERGDSLGRQYERINEILLSISHDLKIDLWSLDSLWWHSLPDQDSASGEPQIEKPLETVAVLDEPGAHRFALEKHLHHFIWENWDKLDLAKDWEIFNEPGDPDLGIEYRSPIGRIDILAKHKREPRWLVIELKRDQSSDQTVGQALRYIGFVQSNLAKGERVEGLIISHEIDKAIQYALSTVQNIKLRTYEVAFTLHEVKEAVLA